jgi:uracil-DNA glycosylase family 4
MKTLTEINAYWSAHNTCDLKATATQPVFGDGNAHADIVFIGEAPGKKEDLEGRPFIGAAGKFLSEMLESVKLKREDVYITNVVKYRPPNNRDPLPSEKESCRQWLNDELSVIKPKLIVFLGRHAMSNFFPKEKISEVHGTLLHKKIDGFPVEYFLPLYHPAAALYNGGLRQALLDDFKKIPSALKRLQRNRNKKATE